MAIFNRFLKSNLRTINILNAFEVLCKNVSYNLATLFTLKTTQVSTFRYSFKPLDF